MTSSTGRLTELIGGQYVRIIDDSAAAREQRRQWAEDEANFRRESRRVIREEDERRKILKGLDALKSRPFVSKKTSNAPQPILVTKATSAQRRRLNKLLRRQSRATEARIAAKVFSTLLPAKDKKRKKRDVALGEAVKRDIAAIVRSELAIVLKDLVGRPKEKVSKPNVSRVSAAPKLSTATDQKGKKTTRPQKPVSKKFSNIPSSSSSSSSVTLNVPSRTPVPLVPTKPEGVPRFKDKYKLLPYPGEGDIPLDFVNNVEFKTTGVLKVDQVLAARSREEKKIEPIEQKPTRTEPKKELSFVERVKEAALLKMKGVSKS